VQLNCTYSNYTEAAAACSAAQQGETVTLMSSAVQCSRLLGIVEIRSFKFTLLAENAVSQFHSDMAQMDVTNITDTPCKLEKHFNIFSMRGKLQICGKLF
jgi:hypothetical protein